MLEWSSRSWQGIIHTHSPSLRCTLRNVPLSHQEAVVGVGVMHAEDFQVRRYLWGHRVLKHKETSSKYFCPGPFPRDSGAAVGRWGIGEILKAFQVTLMCTRAGVLTSSQIKQGLGGAAGTWHTSATELWGPVAEILNSDDLSHASKSIGTLFQTHFCPSSDDRGWDGWMASPTQWPWVWVNSGSWWWTGRPGVLQSVGWQRLGHDWATELNWTVPLLYLDQLNQSFSVEPSTYILIELLLEILIYIPV